MITPPWSPSGARSKWNWFIGGVFRPARRPKRRSSAISRRFIIPGVCTVLWAIAHRWTTKTKTIKPEMKPSKNRPGQDPQIFSVRSNQPFSDAGARLRKKPFPESERKKFKGSNRRPVFGWRPECQKLESTQILNYINLTNFVSVFSKQAQRKTSSMSAIRMVMYSVAVTMPKRSECTRIITIKSSIHSETNAVQQNSNETHHLISDFGLYLATPLRADPAERHRGDD